MHFFGGAMAKQARRSCGSFLLLLQQLLLKCLSQSIRSG